MGTTTTKGTSSKRHTDRFHRHRLKKKSKPKAKSKSKQSIILELIYDTNRMSRPLPISTPSTGASSSSVGQISPPALPQREQDPLNTSAPAPPNRPLNDTLNRRRCPLCILVPSPVAEDPGTYNRLQMDNHIAGETPWNPEEMMLMRSHAVPQENLEEERGQRQQHYYDDGRMRVREITSGARVVTPVLRPIDVPESGYNSISEMALGHIEGYVEIAGRGRDSWTFGKDGDDGNGNINKQPDSQSSNSSSGSAEQSNSPPAASTPSPTPSQQQNPEEGSQNLDSVTFRNEQKLKKAKREMRDRYPGLKENKGDVAGRWWLGNARMWAVERWLEECEEEGALGFPEVEREAGEGGRAG